MKFFQAVLTTNCVITAICGAQSQKVAEVLTQENHNLSSSKGNNYFRKNIFNDHNDHDNKMKDLSTMIVGGTYNGISDARDLQQQPEPSCNVDANITCEVKGKGKGTDCGSIVGIPGRCGPITVTFRLQYCNREEQRVMKLLPDKTIAKIETNVVQGIDRSEMSPGECRTVERSYRADSCEKSFSASIKVEGRVEVEESVKYCYAKKVLEVKPIKSLTGRLTRSPSKGISTGTIPPTAVPTRTPTDDSISTSTMAPTKIPTNTPTKTLTNAPSSTLSNAPTKAPISAPTKTPTDTPTKAPTATPTKVPVEISTKSPTKTPTKAPTNTPTKSLTNIPTSDPTSNVSVAPTHAPYRDTTTLVNFKLECLAETPAPGIYDTPCDTAFNNDDFEGNCVVYIKYIYQLINRADEPVSVLALIKNDGSGENVNQFDETSRIIIAPGGTYKFFDYENIKICHNYGTIIRKKVIAQIIGTSTGPYSLEVTDVFKLNGSLDPVDTQSLSPSPSPLSHIRCKQRMKEMTLKYSKRTCSIDNPPSGLGWHDVRKTRGLKSKDDEKEVPKEYPGVKCIDYYDSQDTDPWIIIKSLRGGQTYFEGQVYEGKSFVVKRDNGRTIGLNTRVQIYDNNGQSLKLIQEFVFHTSCSNSLYLGDEFGSIVLVGFANQKQGSVGRYAD